MTDLFSPEQVACIVLLILVVAGGLCAFGFACLRLLQMKRPGHQKHVRQKQRNTSSQKD